MAREFDCFHDDIGGFEGNNMAECKESEYDSDDYDFETKWKNCEENISSGRG